MTDWSDQIAIQHGKLSRVVDRIRVIAQAPTGVLPPSRLRYLLEAEAADLFGLLREHFDFEERGGYMKGVSIKRPHLAREVDRLEAEHDMLRRAIQELEAMTVTEDTLDDHRRAVVSLLDDVEEHEQAENHLLERYIVEDLGAGD